MERKLSKGRSDPTMFCDFTPQHVVRGWSEMGHTSGVAQIIKKTGINPFY